MWRVYALLSALFAALTAIFAKVGVLAFPHSLRCGYRPVLAVLLQGHPTRRRVQGRTHRQAEHCHHHSPGIHLPEGAGEPERYHRRPSHYRGQCADADEVTAVAGRFNVLNIAITRQLTLPSGIKVDIRRIFLGE